MTNNPHELSLEWEAQSVLDGLPRPGTSREPAAETYRQTNEKRITIAGGPTGSVRARVIRPRGVPGTLPVVLYIHGDGWRSGFGRPLDPLVRALAVGARVAVVVPEYAEAPEARYPVANEQCYAVARWLVNHGAEEQLDGSAVAIAGDSIGGTMAIAVTLMGRARGDVRFVASVLFYPATDASFDTPSYEEFAEGYYLTRDGMTYFWDAYLNCERDRADITVSPLRATAAELSAFPPTLVVTAEADVLRDEGEAFAGHLRDAGVAVTQIRFAGTIHDFLMLEPLRYSSATKAATSIAIAILRDVFETIPVRNP